MTSPKAVAAEGVRPLDVQDVDTLATSHAAILAVPICLMLPHHAKPVVKAPASALAKQDAMEVVSMAINNPMAM